jgi:phage shock protein C
MTTDNPRKLYRSGINRMIGGVCGGAAEYLSLDPTLMRILWILFTVFTGAGIPVYIICLIIVPVNPDHANIVQQKNVKNENVALIVGITLVIIGIALFYDRSVPHFWTLGYPWFGFWPFRWRYIWPTLLILFGLWYIFQNLHREKQVVAGLPGAEPQRKVRLFRCQSNRMIAGVCAGFAKYWDMDVTIVRVIYVVLTLLTNFFLGIVIYFVAVIVIPVEDDTSANHVTKR